MDRELYMWKEPTMSNSRPLSIRSTAALFSLFAFLFVSSNAEAKSWKAAAERQRSMISLADKHNLPRASLQTIQHLQKTVPGLKNISADRVRVVSYSDPAFQNWAREAGQRPLVGMGATPHKGGSHPHFVSFQPKAPGELGNFTWAIDGIQPMWRNRDGKVATFHDGSMMRREPLDRKHSGSARLLALWEGPKGAVTKHGANAYQLYEKHRMHPDPRKRGYNCASFSTTMLSNLGSELKNDRNNPFCKVPVTGFGGSAMPGLLKSATPDIIIHAVPGPVETVNNASGQRVAGGDHRIVLSY